MTDTPIDAKTSWQRAVDDLGRIIRILFFAATALGLVGLAMAMDFSGFTTALAALTIWHLAYALFNVFLLWVLGQLWFGWAFHSSPKAYRAWIKAMLWGVGLFIAAAYVIDR